MCRLYGRSPKGARALDAVPYAHWNTSTFIAGLRFDRMVAPMLLEGPLDGACFLAYVKNFLVPALKQGDIVICDNLPSHKITNARKTIEEFGARLLFLPAYSPDLNPIEMAFSKLKAHLKAMKARSIEQLQKALRISLEQFEPAHCKSFFHHAHYASI